jgi:hypothetical protein
VVRFVRLPRSMLKHWAGHFYALRCESVPCHSVASKLHAIPLHHFAELFRCVALHCLALPSIVSAFRCHAVAMPCHVRLSASIAAHGESKRFHCCSVLRLTYPLLCRSRHCYATLFHCNTLPSQALPSQCRARLVHATPSRYSISSQRNLPFPLFRHCPMPEKRP